jgi:hypothetical protein
VVPVSYSGNRGIGLESIPSVQIPINPPPKSPSMPSINTITPSASQTGATGAASQQEVELSSLTGTALTNSVITGIKNIFNLQDNLSNVSQSVIVNSLNDLYSQYPQLSKSQFLTLYTRATNNLTGYSPLTVQAIKVKLNSELE